MNTAIFHNNLEVVNGQLGKVINHTSNINIDLWADVGQASKYIINPTAAIDITLPPISATISTKTSAFNGHSIFIYNNNNTNPIAIRDSSSNLVTNTYFGGSLSPNNSILLAAGYGGVNDWKVLSIVSATAPPGTGTMQDAYDASLSPATIEFANGKPIVLRSDNPTGYTDFRVSNIAGTDHYLRVNGTSVVASALEALGGEVTGTLTGQVCIGNSQVLGSTGGISIGAGSTMDNVVNSISIGNSLDNYSPHSVVIGGGVGGVADLGDYNTVIGYNSSILDTCSGCTLIGSGMSVPAGSSGVTKINSFGTNGGVNDGVAQDSTIVIGAENGITLFNTPSGLYDGVNVSTGVTTRVIQTSFTTVDSAAANVFSQPIVTNTVVTVKIQLTIVIASGADIGATLSRIDYFVFKDIAGVQFCTPAPENVINEIESPLGAFNLIYAASNIPGFHVIQVAPQTIAIPNTVMYHSTITIQEIKFA